MPLAARHYDTLPPACWPRHGAAFDIGCFSPAVMPPRLVASLRCFDAARLMPAFRQMIFRRICWQRLMLPLFAEVTPMLFSSFSERHAGQLPLDVARHTMLRLSSLLPGFSDISFAFAAFFIDAAFAALLMIFAA